MDLTTQPNEHRCASTAEVHILDLEPCCPRSGNPVQDSYIEIAYTPGALLLEIVSLRGYVDSYRGGRGAVRSMEGMIQQIAADCATAVGVPVEVRAYLNLRPSQKMRLVCRHEQ